MTELNKRPSSIHVERKIYGKYFFFLVVLYDIYEKKDAASMMCLLVLLALYLRVEEARPVEILRRKGDV